MVEAREVREYEVKEFGAVAVYKFDTATLTQEHLHKLALRAMVRGVRVAGNLIARRAKEAGENIAEKLSAYADKVSADNNILAVGRVAGVGAVRVKMSTKAKDTVAKYRKAFTQHPMEARAKALYKELKGLHPVDPKSEDFARVMAAVKERAITAFPVVEEPLDEI